MKVSIKGFLETTFLDWPGQVAAVLFLAGCNYRCPFCHNPELVDGHESLPDLDLGDILARLARHRGWIDGVVVTGGEPTLSPGLAELCRRVKAAGFQVKLDTNGSRPEVLQNLLDNGLVDHVAMDIKAPLDEVGYARACGRPGFSDRVRESLNVLKAAGADYSLRTTLVPGMHSEQDVYLMAEQLRDEPSWTLQKFNPENALDQRYREVETWSQNDFDALSHQAQVIRTGAA